MSSPDWWGSGTKGDIAAGGIGYAAGFGIDILMFPLGVPPGTTAAVFAVGAVGIKNFIQSALQARRAKPRLDDRRRLESRAADFLELLSQATRDSDGLIAPEIAEIAALLSKDLRIWRLQILTDEQFASALDDSVDRFRKLPISAAQ